LFLHRSAVWLDSRPVHSTAWLCFGVCVYKWQCCPINSVAVSSLNTPPICTNTHARRYVCMYTLYIAVFLCTHLSCQTAPKKRSSGVSAPSRQPQEAAVPAPPRTPPLTETPEAGSMTHSELSSFFDSLLRKKKVCRCR